MPVFQVLFSELNARMRKEMIGDIDPELFAEGRRLSETLPEEASALGFALDALPSGIHEAVRAVIRDAIGRQMPVTVAWAPGYDYKLTLWDVADAPDTNGGITLLVETRYPDDPHPLKGTMRQAAAVATRAADAD